MRLTAVSSLWQRFLQSREILYLDPWTIRHMQFRLARLRENKWPRTVRRGWYNRLLKRVKEKDDFLYYSLISAVLNDRPAQPPVERTLN